MSTALATTEAPKGALAAMASRIGAEPEELLTTLKQGVFKDAKPAEFQALVLTAQEYQLNPILKELYAFPAKGGGIVPIVSIDGWLKIINRQPKLDGLSVDMSTDGKEATCTIHVKDREHPVVVTEYLDECKRNTEPWKTMPRRMLRHKAIIQGARVAFGIGGVFDEDEGKDAAGMRDVTPPTKARVKVSPTADFTTPEIVTKEAPEPQSQPLEEPVPEPEKPQKERPPGKLIKATFLEKSVKKGVTDGKPWTRYGFNLSLGDKAFWAGTFSGSIGSLGFAPGTEVLIIVEKKGEHYELLWIEEDPAQGGEEGIA